MADQPSCSKATDVKSDKTSGYDPCLDFYSEKFDPLKALQAANIKIPVPNATLYDNLAQYDTKQKRTTAPKVKQEPAPVFERKFAPHQMPVPRKRKEFIPKTVLSEMEKFKGPLTLLKKCVDERLRLKVWTRHSHGIRGYCLSFCVAFDKHWNLALEDVTEVWTRPRSRKVPALGSLQISAEISTAKRKIIPPTVVVTKRAKKTEYCERHVPQLIIRGEQVAFINIVQ